MSSSVQISAESTSVEVPTVEEKKAPDLANPQVVKELVQEFFNPNSVMVEIARCESQFQHLSKSGEPIRGIVNNHDVGVMQINEYYHDKTATALGLDLRKFEDNLAYAKYLYDREGTTPWLSSSPCWGIGNHISRR